jgi:hypothetical protein
VVRERLDYRQLQQCGFWVPSTHNTLGASKTVEIAPGTRQDYAKLLFSVILNSVRATRVNSPQPTIQKGFLSSGVAAKAFSSCFRVRQIGVAF